MRQAPIFFTYRNCPFYPCHQGLEQLNCLFCFCPLYHRPTCPGNPRFLPGGIKDCSHCVFPHLPQNYQQMLDELAAMSH